MASASGVRPLSAAQSISCRDCLTDQRLRALISIHGTPLLIIDCNQVRQNYRRLRAALPGVVVHYAIKALPQTSVLGVLSEEGSHFDVASVGELELLREQPVPVDRVIHTHPIKTVEEIRGALAYGCRTFVFDNADELAKFAPFRERVQLILRIGFRNADATVDLSKKFGAPPSAALDLLALARRLGLGVVGFSFHVGSQCADSRAHVRAIETCALLMTAAERAGHPPLRVLDIGGGFPAPYTADVPTIEDFCAPIRSALRQLPSRLRIVSEPGRFLVASAGHSAAGVVGKANRDGEPWYYLDDGIYGSFGAQVFDGIYYPLSVLTAHGRATGPQFLSRLAGPTCDSGDMVSDGIPLPTLRVGDVIVAHVMGAYSCVTANDFNSVKRATVVALDGPAASGQSGTMLKAFAE